MPKTLHPAIIAVVSYWRKYVHEVLVNCLGGLSLPRKSVVRLTDSPDMTLDVYCGRKTTIQPTNLPLSEILLQFSEKQNTPQHAKTVQNAHASKSSVKAMH